MDMLKDKFKYKKIKNFLTKEETALLLDYTRITHRLNFHNFDKKQNNNCDTKLYGDPVMESLMIQKRDFISKEINLNIYPTYAFWRMYTFNANLEEHEDRPSCEISATVMLGSCGTSWPIFMEDTPIDLEPGDAILYRGCDLKHSRDHFEGDWHSQVFLHYVDVNGPYIEYAKDKRLLWGEQKN